MKEDDLLKSVGTNIAAKSAIGVVLLVLPVVYVAEILATILHEVLGHGLSAVLLGGEFSGFVVRWDAMGWAYSSLPTGASLTEHILYLASGVIVTTGGGLLIWGLTPCFRTRPHIQLILLVTALMLLMDGISYVLWNAWHPVPPGDIGKILMLSHARFVVAPEVVRWILVFIGAASFVGVTFCFCASIFVRMEALVLQGGQFVGGSRFLALFFGLVLPGSYEWLSFDWNQLAPGVGWVPNIAGAVSVVVVATVLFWWRPGLKCDASTVRITWKQVAISWICLVATILALALGLAHGVRW